MHTLHCIYYTKLLHCIRVVSDKHRIDETLHRLPTSSHTHTHHTHREREGSTISVWGELIGTCMDRGAAHEQYTVMTVWTHSLPPSLPLFTTPSHPHSLSPSHSLWELDQQDQLLISKRMLSMVIAILTSNWSYQWNLHITYVTLW